MTRKTFAGGCHCGAVRFQAELEPGMEARTCTCSMCAKVGFVHLIAPASRFRLLHGAGALTRYAFNTGVAEHLFCKHCGVKSFYRPRSKPEGWSINLRCLDDAEALAPRMGVFDGANWEAHAAELKHLSED